MNLIYLNDLRIQEIKDILNKHLEIFRNKHVLEIGGGTGVQAREITKVSASIVSLEIKETNYLQHVPSHVTFYDGYNIPFPDNYFDAIFSSNVLEHIAHRDEFQKELYRVLKPNGYAVHVMPTHWWKLRDVMQSIMLLPKETARLVYRFIRGRKNSKKIKLLEFIFGERHGEFGNTFTELYFFLPSTWKKKFYKSGFTIIATYPGGIFYTGKMWLAQKLSFKNRKILARLFGSSVYIFVLKK